MFKCNECESIFDTILKEREIIGVDNQIGYITYEYCPICHSTDFKEYEEEEDDE